MVDDDGSTFAAEVGVADGAGCGAFGMLSVGAGCHVAIVAPDPAHAVRNRTQVAIPARTSRRTGWFGLGEAAGGVSTS
jgi:hypothetical protein